MTHRVSKRDIVLFVIAQVVSISLLVLFFSQLLHNLSSVFQLVYIVAALLVVVVDILLIRKIMTRREEPTVLNQLKASKSYRYICRFFFIIGFRTIFMGHQVYQP